MMKVTPMQKMPDAIAPDMSQTGVDAAVKRAADVTPALTRLDHRARSMRAAAAALDAAGADLVPLAADESALTRARLTGELARTTFQLRFLADLVDDGDFLDATIDHADPCWPPGPRPDLRRINHPIGPVAVFAASNFPFAFSVAGGDTAAALAAGCPVVVKAHPGHPRLSAAVGALLRGAIEEIDIDPDVVQLVYGVDAGRHLLLHPAVRAAAFTGSVAGGTALLDLAASRSDPIPFYGELGSLNPVVVTPEAARTRLADIAAGFRSSFTLGAGQFCTKPGLLVVPVDCDLTALTTGLADMPPARMLTHLIHAGYQARLSELIADPHVDVLVAAASTSADTVSPTLLVSAVSHARSPDTNLLRECFGPASVVLTYVDEPELLAFLDGLPGQLAAAVFGHPDDPLTGAILTRLASHAGRVLHNSWPTGVAVTWAMQHGGPYPATTTPTTTSVGTAAVARFLRPVAYQSIPDTLLPPELRDANPLGLPRRVDGHRVDPARARIERREGTQS